MRCALRSLLLLAGAATPLLAQDRVFSLPSLPPLAEVSFSLSSRAGDHTLELRGFRPEAEPLLNLIDGAGAQVGRAAGQGSQLTLSIPGTLAGGVVAVIRSRASTAVETADLWVDGQPAQTGLRFSAGWAIPMSGIADGETAEAVMPPNGPRSHFAYLVSADGNDILARSGGGRSRLRLPAGGNVVALYGARAPESGPFRVYRNDAAHDSDGDGLGDGLETAIGTCGSATGSVAGAECGDLADPRDTDGDGLRDGWEALGYNASWQSGGATVRRHLPLQAWGADPRHKDIFVEVDFRRLDRQENEDTVIRMMSPMVARQLAAIYGDSATTDGVLRAVHAVSMDNPDRRAGISLHLDTGVPPLTPADATIHGDWGGFNPVDAVPDSAGEFRPQAPQAVWREQMSPARHGIFHYVMGYTSGGGSCGGGIACGFNMTDPGNSAHEFGHTLGLDHNGPYGTHEPNCKPNYPSLMNYAYTSQQRFSDGSALAVLNNHALVETGGVDPANGRLVETLRSVFQYQVDSATGSVDWNRDNQFAPAGAPVRAYGNLQPGNSCEGTREGETATGMMSRRSPAIVKYNDHLWVFTVTLEGKLAYTYTPGRFLCANIDDCPQLAFHPPAVREIAVDGVDAAVITVQGRKLLLVVGITPEGGLFETWMEERNGLFVWDGPVPIAGSPAAGEPSLAVTQEGNAVLLTYRGRDNVVRYRYRSPAAFRAEEIMQVGGKPLVMSPEASPAVAFTRLPLGFEVAGREQVVAAVIDTFKTVQLYTTDRLRRGWLRLGIPYGYMGSATGRPAMAWVGPLPSNTTVAAGDAVQPAGDRPARPHAGRVDRAGRADRAVRHAAAATLAEPTTYGRFYIMYIRDEAPVPGATDPDPVKMQFSYVDAGGKLRIGHDTWFDNVWSYGFGIDLLQPGELALRAAQAYAIPNAPNHPNSLFQVQVRPHADGIVNLPYRNYDDWKVIGWGSCVTLRPVQTPAMQVTCRDKNW